MYYLEHRKGYIFHWKGIHVHECSKLLIFHESEKEHIAHLQLLWILELEQFFKEILSEIFNFGDIC